MLKKEQVEELEQLVYTKLKRALSSNRNATANDLADLLLRCKALQTPTQSPESANVIGFIQEVDEDEWAEE